MQHIKRTNKITEPSLQNLCYLGLGSNKNKPIKQIVQAIKHIQKLHSVKIIQVANYYLSKAWGVENQADFVNTAIKIRTSLSPHALLKTIKTIEYRLMNRIPNHKWHERVIDIDILLYERQKVNRPELTIPHAWMADRAFVITPLLELSPKLNYQLKQAIKIHPKNSTGDALLTPLRAPQARSINLFLP